MKRIISLILFILILSAGFSQVPESSEEETIVLPALSTTIESSGAEIDAEAIPDFSLILPEKTAVLPVIKDAVTTGDSFVPPAAKDEGKAGNDTFIEGRLGTGYPVFFSGDFSITGGSSQKPFSLGFSHETLSGYGLHSASDGFNSSLTILDGEKVFTPSETVSVYASGFYKDSVNGLQGNSPLFYNLSYQTVSGKASVAWKTSENMTLSGGSSVFLSNQFAGFTGAVPAGLTTSETSFIASPEAELLYTGSGFGLSLLAGGDFGVNQKRFSFGFDVSVDCGGYMDMDVNANVLFASQSSASTLFPFAVELKSRDNLPFAAALSGGLRSSPADLALLQENNPYCFTGIIPVEESEWFCDAAFSVPVKNLFDIAADINYAYTAFDGGRLISGDTADAVTGLLSADVQNIAVFDTKLRFVVPVSIWSFSCGWNASWLDCLDAAAPQALALEASVLPASGLWGFTAAADLYFNGEVPLLGLTGFYRLSRDVRLEAEVSDMAKLFSGTDRIAAGPYKARGGYAAVFVKMYFGHQ